MVTAKLKTLLQEELKISENNAEVYLAFVGFGPATVGEIAILLGSSFSNVEKAVRSLQKKRIIIEHPGIVKRYSTTPPFQKFQSILDLHNSDLGKAELDLTQNIKKNSSLMKRKLKKKEKEVKLISQSFQQELDETSQKTLLEILDQQKKEQDISSKTTGQIKSTLNEHLTNQIHGMQDSLKGTEAKTNKILQAYFQKNNEFGNQRKQELLSSVKELSTVFLEEMKKTRTVISLQDKALTKKIQTSRKKFEKKGKTRERNIIQNINEVLEGINEKLENEINRMTEETMNSNVKYLEDLRGFFVKQQSNLKKKLNEETEVQNSKIQNIRTQEDTILTGIKSKLLTTLSKLNQVTKDNLTNNNEIYQNDLETISQAIEKYTNDLGYQLGAISKNNVTDIEKIS
ncbi:MAG: helix-turn-helix domain-containing protein, partial [Candidatus Ranarchaeia archaeon]